jgi:hypothetical protein
VKSGANPQLAIKLVHWEIGTLLFVKHFVEQDFSGSDRHPNLTQYGFHKSLNTKEKSLLPYYELKFNAKGLPKQYWNEVYDILNTYRYFVRDSDDKKPTKFLWLGEISLSGETDKQVGNLIEALFAVTILKSHYKGAEKGYEFDFLCVN